MAKTKTKAKVLPPGEGERRAQRGYVSQYDFAAQAIYKAIAAGTLQWVGLADRSAGNFDDLVLGLSERIVAHQIKTRSDPAKFSVRTLLLGRTSLLTSFVSVWKALTKTENLPVEVLYVCDEVPAGDDSIAKSAAGPSSAAFLRALEVNRSTRSLEERLRSPCGPLVSEIEDASGLERSEFARFLSSVRFLHSGLGRGTGAWGETPLDRRRIADISALLPRLIADEKDKDRWSLEEFLQRLNWTDPFSPRRGHTFPTDALVQSNRKTMDTLQMALDANSSGYVSLAGPPGCGKSTLLQIGLLPSPQAVVIRYLAFMPNEGHHLGRAEAQDFLYDIVAQLKRSGLGHGLVTGTTLDELRLQVGQLLLQAKKRFEQDGLRTIVVIDGLDHIPREERPQRSLLNELPLPDSLPMGVLFVLGTQKVDLNGIPPEVRDQASAPGRLVTVEPLSREAVFRLVEVSGLSEPDDAQIIFEQSLGHPLSVRYLIEGARNAISTEERKNWLRDGPAYGGDVENFYRRAWHGLEGKEDAREVLALLALVEGKIRVSSLDQLVDSRSVDAAWDSAKHLLLRTPDDEWRIFHNSFRLFLREVTSRRHDKPAPALRRDRYKKLASMARSATLDDEQRWMELRYLARGEDHPTVIALCDPARFRQQFIEGRTPQAIFDDIRLAFVAVASTKSARRLVELILARHEIEMRTAALGVDRLIDAYIAVNDLDRAMGVIDAGNGRLSVGKAYDVIEALLVEGRQEDARRLFEDHEPISKLLGAEPVDGFSDDRDLSEWAERAALFRSPAEILTSISRLRSNPDRRDNFDLTSLCAHLPIYSRKMGS